MQAQLTEEMNKAAAAQEYERAAELRDLLADLRRTTEKVQPLRTPALQPSPGS